MSAHLSSLSNEKLASELRSGQPLMLFIWVNSNTGEPSVKTLRTCRDTLGEAIENLFAEFNECLAEAGLVATKGHIVASTTVKAAVGQGGRDENRTIKGGGTPDDWKGKPAKLRQKDREARRLKKDGKDACEFKIHTLVDAGRKLIRNAVLMPASVHDSQVFGPLIEGAG